MTWWPIADALNEQITIDPEWDNGGLSVSAANHMIREIFIAWMQAFTADEDCWTRSRRSIRRWANAPCRTTEPG